MKWDQRNAYSPEMVGGTCPGSIMLVSTVSLLPDAIKVTLFRLLVYDHSISFWLSILPFCNTFQGFKPGSMRIPEGNRW